ncbi:MAG TPA: BTAD domain-containing putative transcriptional regulator [Actinomycetales bacterium]|nr:BTAD domain-containing putative transcriptional regulator [Actinomycetales bacterium]
MVGRLPASQRLAQITDGLAEAATRLAAHDPDDGQLLTTAPLAVQLLGQFRVLRDGVEIPPNAFGSRHVRQFVQLLVTRRGVVVHRSALSGPLWPTMVSTSSAAASLSVLASRARRALGDSTLIVSRAGGYLFSAEHRCVVDAEIFQRWVRAGRVAAAAGNHSAALQAYRSALALWSGEPLLEVDGEWAGTYRQRMRRLRLECLEGMAASGLETGQPTVALAFAEEAAVLAPDRDEVLLLLMRALAEVGSPSDAIDRYEAWRARLAEEKGLDPSPQAVELFGRLLRGEYPPRRDGTTRPRHASARRSRPAADRLIGILAAVPEAVWVLDRLWRFTEVNPRAAELLGRRREDLVDRCAWDVLRGDPAESLFRRAEQGLGEEGNARFHHLHPPTAAWLRVHAQLSAGDVVIAASDVTADMNLKEALEQSVAQLRAMQADVPADGN